MTTNRQKNDYGADSITVLEGLDPVRKRPGMYIGTTSQAGVNHSLNEIVDNGIDEALAGHATSIRVIIGENGYMTVFDNGRGIPIEVVDKYKKSALELVMTMLHAGGKFGQGAYKVSGGLHGVGASVVNALSEHLIAEVKRGGKIYRQEYVRGIPKYDVKLVTSSILNNPFDSGTAISFRPDPQIFKETTEINYVKFKKQIKEKAYLIPHVMFHIENKKEIDKTAYYFEGGILSLIRDMNKGKKTIHDPIYIKDSDDGIEIEVAIQFNDSLIENVHTFVNVINTAEGGTHLTGFRSALTKSINTYAGKVLPEKDFKENFSGNDIKEGLSAVVYVKMSSNDLQFKDKQKQNWETQKFSQSFKQK